ncbi:MarR family transcriptional regulator [Actinomadura rubrisoli]|uniref:MarR family transcriptional regulator n=1 Tax=Actinomadura rubrisoli TaxID=2530368 RepID=A0A4R5CEQ2_9ACTN|nr:MarR family transcriptional regulator [Actinomadura rubrisoli]
MNDSAWSTVFAVTESRNQPTGAAFLLAQLGAHAANRFAARIADLGLSPADVGLLRMIAARPGRSQQSLAADLGVVPSRVTALIDPLDRAGLVERRRSTGDRRNYELHLTPEAARVMDEIKKTAIAHEADITSALDPSQRAQLITLLELIAADQNLTPGVHPGYRR